MNTEQIAERVAKDVVAAGFGPVMDSLNGRASGTQWDVLHDIENGLEDAAQRYDIAASYTGGEGSSDAAGMRDAIMSLKDQVERISMKAFGRMVKLETQFIRKFGTPDEYSEAQRESIFPN